MRIFLIVASVIVLGWAHPVSYTIDLEVKYDKIKKEATVYCKSNSRNKCGLHNFHFLDKDNTILKTAKFPFLKKKTTITVDKKPSKMIFFLRKIPEHTYTVIIE
jgi:hypothetical protein